MSKKGKPIPVNHFGDKHIGISIQKVSAKNLGTFGNKEQSHRDNFHLFFLQEKGTTSIEIDFHKHKIKPLSVAYIYPNQVHRVIAFEDAIFIGLAINNENLNPEYLKLLEDIAPTKPLLLNKETFAIISEAVSLCIKFSERKQEKLYPVLLKDSCNTLVALIASQYLGKSKPADKLSRFEIITKAFKSALERDFVTVKSPTEYAQKLNISASYLNECIKSTTDYSVSYLIQQRIVLEAKRLLYYSDKSVKEIAIELGYEDYTYFSRLFTKVTGISALTFRNKNRK